MKSMATLHATQRCHDGRLYRNLHHEWCLHLQESAYTQRSILTSQMSQGLKVWQPAQQMSKCALVQFRRLDPGRLQLDGCATGSDVKPLY